MLAANSSKKLKNEFSRLCLSSSTLPTDDNTLVFLSSLHKVVGIVCNGKDVRRLFTNLFVSVLVDVLLVVNWKQLVGVDGYQNGASVGLWMKYRKGL